MNTVFSKRLGLSLPVIQAPMAGGGDTPDLVAAVCEAGGLGSVGAAYLGPEQILRAGEEVRRRTKRPFGISLFAPTAEAAPPADAGKMLLRLASYHEELGIPIPALLELVESAGNNFEDQLGTALQTEASVFSFTFGMLPSSATDAIRARGLVLLGTATTVNEAIALERAGVDAVVVQGSEAGGHRGSFLPDSGEVGAVGTASLVPQAADAVKVPVIASGGIMDGRGRHNEFRYKDRTSMKSRLQAALSIFIRRGTKKSRGRPDGSLPRIRCRIFTRDSMTRFFA